MFKLIKYTLNMCRFGGNQLYHHTAVLNIKSRASKKKKEREPRGTKLGLRKKTWRKDNEDEVILRKC